MGRVGRACHAGHSSSWCGAAAAACGCAAPALHAALHCSHLCPWLAGVAGRSWRRWRLLWRSTHACWCGPGAFATARVQAVLNTRSRPMGLLGCMRCRPAPRTPHGEGSSSAYASLPCPPGAERRDLRIHCVPARPAPLLWRAARHVGPHAHGCGAGDGSGLQNGWEVHGKQQHGWGIMSSASACLSSLCNCSAQRKLRPSPAASLCLCPQSTASARPTP